jgi:hypothetical protein
MCKGNRVEFVGRVNSRCRADDARSNRASRHDRGYTELALDLVRLTVAISSFRSTRVLV